VAEDPTAAVDIANETRKTYSPKARSSDRAIFFATSFRNGTKTHGPFIPALPVPAEAPCELARYAIADKSNSPLNSHQESTI
jgi:hypothetical protein